MYLHEKYWDPQQKIRLVPPVIYPKKEPMILGRMKEYLTTRGLDYGLAFKYGWYPALYNGPRVIVPCASTIALWWQGRLIDHHLPTEIAAKWKRWDSPVGWRGDAVCYLQVVDADTILIVEGPLDALKAAMLGYSAIATLGTTPGLTAIKHIASISKDYSRRLLLPDTDAISDAVRLQRYVGLVGSSLEIIELNSGYKDLAATPFDLAKELLG